MTDLPNALQFVSSTRQRASTPECTPNALKAYTRPGPAPWTQLGERLGAVDSTNRLLHDRAQAAARAGAPLTEGTSLRADFQTAGRGRHDRTWEGRPGDNLYVSYLLSPAGLPAARLFTLSQALALAVRDAVDELAPGREALVKWPNDVFLDGGKVAGLLVEAGLAGARVLYVVAGVGLNVNQRDFPGAPQATSLRVGLPRDLDVGAVWDALTRRLQVAHAALAEQVGAGDTYPTARRYHEHLLGFGEWARYTRRDGRGGRDGGRDGDGGGATFAARLQGVDADGRLVLEHGGRERRYSMDEVRYLGPLRPL